MEFSNLVSQSICVSMNVHVSELVYHTGYSLVWARPGFDHWHHIVPKHHWMMPWRPPEYQPAGWSQIPSTSRCGQQSNHGPFNKTTGPTDSELLVDLPGLRTRLNRIYLFISGGGRGDRGE